MTHTISNLAVQQAVASSQAQSSVSLCQCYCIDWGLRGCDGEAGRRESREEMSRRWHRGTGGTKEGEWRRNIPGTLDIRALSWQFSSIQKKRTAAHCNDTCKSIDVIISVMPGCHREKVIQEFTMLKWLWHHLWRKGKNQYNWLQGWQCK